MLIEGFLTDISVTKTAGSGSVKQGAQLTYTITASNADPSSAENVTLTDSIPAALTGVEFSTDGGVTFNPWPGILGFGTMVSGKTQTILIRGTARPDAQGSISNTADVTSTPPDPIRITTRQLHLRKNTRHLAQRPLLRLDARPLQM